MKVKLMPWGIIPTRAHKTDAGLDLYAPHDAHIPAKGSVVIDTGVCVELPHGTTGFLKSKSGLNVKHGIISDGVIDEGYTGSIKVKLYNLSDNDYRIIEGDKVTQLVVLPCLCVDVEIADDITGGDRGANGFGSSGR